MGVKVGVSVNLSVDVRLGVRVRLGRTVGVADGTTVLVGENSISTRQPEKLTSASVINQNRRALSLLIIIF